MSMQSAATPRSVSKVKVKSIPVPPRKRKTPINIEHEDDEWLPPSAAVTPTRVASEFFENDYDVM